MAATHHDILIIGGGITGACLAWDAVNRGLSVALIEKLDFGSATSSASSKLLHGGIRYLQQGRIDKVRESAFERIYYQRMAPHLTKYVPFVVPSYPNIAKSKMFLRIGMWLYSFACIGQNRRIKDIVKKVPGWKMLNVDQVSQYIPGIELAGITGGALFYESHMQNSERMTLAFIMSAAHKGAMVANYAAAEDFIKNGSTITGVNVIDSSTNKQYDIHASCVVNAAGPWIPLLNKGLATKKIVTAFSMGVHIVTSQITTPASIALPTKKQNQAIINRGGRHVFVIPWRGCSLIGTTYNAYSGDLNKVRPTEHDIEELIADINEASGKLVLRREDVKYSFAGIYPLIDNEINTKVYQGTGDYQVVDHAANDDCADGLFTVFGAKFTTARLLAEKALNQIQNKFKKNFRPCQTRYLPLPCGDIDDLTGFHKEKKIQYGRLISEKIIDHLIVLYGRDVDLVLNYVQKDSCWRKTISENHLDIEAQIIFSVEHEMAAHLDDFLFRRTGLGTTGNPGDKVIFRCADIMSECLQWNEVRRQAEIERVFAYYEYTHSE
jgi:glycerol-3-phosphate dehydrogenase